MIDFIENNNFFRYEKKIAAYLSENVDDYFSSNCFKALKKRYERLNESIDMAQGKRSASNNTWQSKISIPLVLESVNARKATLDANFRADPLLTVLPVGATPYENSIRAQQVLDSNIRITRFREHCFDYLKASASKYGSAVSFAMLDNNLKRVPKTVETQMGQIEQVMIPKRKKCILNLPVHILNYFQNPNIASPHESNFRGFIKRTFLSDLMSLVENNDRRYIVPNLMKVVKESKESLLKDKNFYSKTSQSWKFGGVDIVRWYGTINIPGNETDDTIYYVEMVGDTIIRFQTNDLDDDLIPINVFTLVKRQEYWWGNTDAEYRMPFENYMNLIMQMAADQGLKELESYIFYNGGTIDISKLNDAKKNGGLVNVDWKDESRPISELFYPYQKPASNYTGLQYLMRELKEGAQRITNQADLSRTAVQGGIQNKTLGAAQMVQNAGDIREASIFESFAFGLQGVGYSNLTMLQQFLSNQFYVRPKMEQAQEVVEKREILGNYNFEVESALTVNEQEEAVRLQNVLTALANFKGTQDQTWQNVNTAPIARTWIKRLTAKSKVDLDTVFPEAAGLQKENYQPSQVNPMQNVTGPVQEVGQEEPNQMVAA